jgi:hypothetical protein
VLKIEVEQEIVETQPTTIAGALVKLALVTARAQSYLGACDPMGREAHEEMTRLLWDVAAASQEAIPFLLQIPAVRDYRSALASYTTNDVWGAAACASGTA